MPAVNEQRGHCPIRQQCAVVERRPERVVQPGVGELVIPTLRYAITAILNVESTPSTSARGGMKDGSSEDEYQVELA